MNSRYVAIPKVVEESQKTTQPLWSRRACRYWSEVFLSRFIELLWLAPIISLWYFNFTTYRIGPSASCPPHGCKADPLAASDSRWAQSLDYNDHNTLGGLQLVAKFLELWFLLIAISLVYNITMLLASNRDGLPIGLLSSPVEFADPRSLWESFRAFSSSPALSTAKERPQMRRKLYFFIGFLSSMCLLVNLMGPAVAVLVLPALRWVDLPKSAQHRFNISGIDRILVALEWELQPFPNCTDEDIVDRRYSCTSLPYASSLDSWDDSVIASHRQLISGYSEAQMPGISPEGDVFFTFNVSANSSLYDVAWAPNRQALREVSADLDVFHQASQNLGANPRYGAYNRSLNTVLKRTGPIFGAIANTYLPLNTTSIIVGHEREIRCYDGYGGLNKTRSDNFSDGIYTKCFRVGTGWNSQNKQARFSVVASQYSSVERVQVSTFFSDQAAYFNETFNPDLIPSSCFFKATVSAPQNFTFDRVFPPHEPHVFQGLSSNILNVELGMPEGFPNQPIVFEIITFAEFSTYSLDTSPQKNPMYIVQVDDIPNIEKSSLQSIPVDPDWLLAAWSVDHEGLVANRSASISLIRGYKAYFGWPSFDNVTFEETSGGESSNSASDSTISVFPSSNLLTAAPISTSTAGTASGEFVNGSGAVSSVSSSSGMTLVAREFSTSALDVRVKREESFPISATSILPSKSLSPTYDEESPWIDLPYSISADDSDDQQINDLTIFIFFSYLQALSMVPYTKSNLTSDTHLEKDPLHPIIWYWARVHVWAYGTDSRTSKLGVVVTVLGAVCVIASAVLGMIWRRKQRSLTNLIVAALKYRHEGELDHVAGNDQLEGKTRYKITDDGPDEHVHFTPL